MPSGAGRVLGDQAAGEEEEEETGWAADRMKEGGLFTWVMSERYALEKAFS